MAVNTRLRRSSTNNHMPWDKTGFVPDSSIGQGDRQAIGHVYSGISAGLPGVPGRRLNLWWVRMCFYLLTKNI